MPLRKNASQRGTGVRGEPILLSSRCGAENEGSNSENVESIPMLVHSPLPMSISLVYLNPDIFCPHTTSPKPISCQTSLKQTSFPMQKRRISNKFFCKSIWLYSTCVVIATCQSQLMLLFLHLKEPLCLTVCFLAETLILKVDI